MKELGLRKYLLFLLLALNSVISIAQDDTLAIDLMNADEIIPRQRIYYQFTPRLYITVPHPLSNAAFKKTFVGIYEVNAGLNLGFYKNFFAGVTYKNNLLKITQKKIPNYNASMSMNSAAIKAGSDFYLNEKNTVLFSVALSAGQNSTKYSSLICKDPAKQPAITEFKSTYYEPEASFFFFTESNFAFGFIATYSIIKRTFDPYELCLNEWSAYSKNNSGPTQYLSFGFGFYYGFFTRKSS